MSFLDRLLDPRAWNIWKHPFVYVIVLCSFVTLLAMSLDIMYTLANKMIMLEEPAAAALWMDKDLSAVFVSVLWVAGFSVGLIGSAMTVMNIIRARVHRVVDFSRLAVLSEDDHARLMSRLDSGELTARNLAALWGEKGDE